MTEKFVQSNYIKEYNKKHYKSFRVDLKNDELKEIDKLIKINNFNSRRDFLLKCIEIMNSENNCIKKEHSYK